MVSLAKQNLIIRADAGTKIGVGHLMRSFALAQNWQASGGTVTFVTNCEAAALREKLKGEGFETVEIENSYPHPSDWKILNEVLRRDAGSWCVVDGYHFDGEFLGQIRKNGNPVLVIDDTVRLPFYDADAVLNQNIDAEDLSYNCPKDTRLLLGTRYTLLRSEFLSWRNWQREIPKAAAKILITAGGGDLHNQTLKAIRAVELLAVKNLQIKVVVGSGNPHFAHLEKYLKNLRLPVELIKSAPNMAKLMAWADVAISAAGSTCWEMAFLRLPCLLLVTAENQLGIAAGLHKKGFAENLGWFEQVTKEEIAKKLSEVLADERRRKQMSRCGREIVDGRGAQRVAAALTR